MLQDARAQQHLAHRRRRDVEHLVDQVADQGAVLGHQLFDELARVGMTVQGHRGQAKPSRPALGPLDQGVQRIRRQRSAALSQQQACLGRTEREVAGPDLG